MQSGLLSLSKIFTEKIFRIPDYQRGYSWSEKHLKDFWNDIEQVEKGGAHYTGVLTLEPASEEGYKRWDDDIWIIESKYYRPMYIVDGQQRLTTAVILIQQILERMGDDELLNYTSKEEIRKKYIFENKGRGISRTYIFGYEKDNPSYEFLKERIFDQSSENHSLDEETIYTKNLLIAKDFFKSKLEGVDSEKLSEIYIKVTQNLLFNIFFIEKELDVFVTFETMNNRGKPLSHLELLKNRLIYLSTKFGVDRHESGQLRKNINESWKSVYHYLGMIESRSFNDDSFLKTHYILYFKNKTKEYEEKMPFFDTLRMLEYAYKDELLENFFNPKRLYAEDAKKLTIEQINEYAASVKKIIKVFYQVVNPWKGDWDDLEIEKLSQIIKVSSYEIFVLTMAVMLEFKKSEKRLGVLNALERYGFLRGISQSSGGINLVVLINKVLSNSINEEALSREIDEVGDKIYKSEDFYESLRAIGKTSNGYYRWPRIRYFMYEYEQYLRKKSKTSRQLLRWSDDFSREVFELDHKTIEHIYPQKASDKYWSGMFRGHTVSERNRLKNSLGNLLPISHSKNASLGNKSFEVKKGNEENQVGYRYGCLSEIQVSNNKDWGAIEIIKRGVYLLDFMEGRWRIKIGDRRKKVRILGLDSVVEKMGLDLDKDFSVSQIVPEPPKELVEYRSDVVGF